MKILRNGFLFETSHLVRLEIFRPIRLIVENPTTPVSRGEPPSHGTTKDCRYPDNIYRQQLCHKVTTIVHSGQHFPLLRNLFESKSWNEIIECPLWEYGSRGHFDLLIQTTNFIAWFLRQQIASFDFISFMRILTNQVLCQMKKFLIWHFYIEGNCQWPWFVQSD